jgi:hypothetical protein
LISLNRGRLSGEIGKIERNSITPTGGYIYKYISPSGGIRISITPRDLKVPRRSFSRKNLTASGNRQIAGAVGIYSGVVKKQIRLTLLRKELSSMVPAGCEPVNFYWLNLKKIV